MLYLKIFLFRCYFVDTHKKIKSEFFDIYSQNMASSITFDPCHVQSKLHTPFSWSYKNGVLQTISNATSSECSLQFPVDWKATTQSWFVGLLSVMAKSFFCTRFCELKSFESRRSTCFGWHIHCKTLFCWAASRGSTYRFLQIYKHEATRRLVTIAVNAMMAGTFIFIDLSSTRL